MNAKRLPTPISAAGGGGGVMKFRNLLSLGSHFKDEPEEGTVVKCGLQMKWVTVHAD
jgi:hypothetical protein